MSNSSPPPVRVVGFQWSPAAHEVKDFLARSRVAYTWMDLDSSSEGRRLLEEMGLAPGDVPLVIFPDGTHLTSPSDADIAEKIGLSTEADRPFYDLVIVGGGPAGLAAAVYGASEGLRTIVIEREAPGGQAGQSARIENYLGFPDGLTGGELAHRAVAQAKRFGCEVIAARGVTELRADDPFRVVKLDDGDEIFCHTVLLATGVNWRTLEAPGCRDLIGAGVYYGAASAEAQSFNGKDVYLIGGGNSAGQAAVHLSRFARSVHMLAMEDDLSENMSKYLLDRIEGTENIHVRSGCTVSDAGGSGKLESLTIQDVKSETCETVPANALFVFIGAVPETEWLEGTVQRDDDGFILSGDLRAEDSEPLCWPLERRPYMLETSMPGVFVAGDARSGSVKRVGSAVGEGSMAIQFIHAYVAER